MGDHGLDCTALTKKLGLRPTLQDLEQGPMWEYACECVNAIESGLLCVYLRVSKTFFCVSVRPVQG